MERAPLWVEVMSKSKHLALGIALLSAIEPFYMRWMCKYLPNRIAMSIPKVLKESNISSEQYEEISRLPRIRKDKKQDLSQWQYVLKELPIQVIHQMFLVGMSTLSIPSDKQMMDWAICYNKECPDPDFPKDKLYKLAQSVVGDNMVMLQRIVRGLRGEDIEFPNFELLMLEAGKIS